MEIINIRIIVALFYFTYWFFRNTRPFNIWWLILVIAIDYIISIIILDLTKKVMEKKRT